MKEKVNKQLQQKTINTKLYKRE